MNGEVFENSSGSGAYDDTGSGVYNLTFSDDLTNFTGVYNANTGCFVGSAKQKDISGTGSFNLQRQ